MKPFISTLITAVLVALPAQAQGNARAKAEAQVSEAAQFARDSGSDRLLKEVNGPNGRFANRAASKPQLIVYDLTGKILAHSMDVRHVGMDHAKAIPALLEHAKQHVKGWFKPSLGGGGMEATTYFERVGDMLITAPLQGQ